MKDLITEARELCEKATPGEWTMEYSDGDWGAGVSSDETGYLVATTKQHTFDHQFIIDATFIAKSHSLIPELCDALEKAEGKLDYLHEEIGSVRAQLHTATFSTNKGAADMAKFILALLPAPPEEGE